MSCLPLLTENINVRGRATARSRSGFIVALTFLLFSAGIFNPQQLAAEQHVVSLEELREQIQAAHETRDSHLREIQGFLSSKAAAKSLTTVGLDAAQVENLVPMLDDSELARLAGRTRGIERDLAAGALNNQQLTYIVIALATAIIVILAT